MEKQNREQNREKRLLRAVGDIDDDLIEEARPGRKRAPVWRKAVALAVAASILLFTGLNLILFIPFSTAMPDVSGYADSQYYSVIKALNEYGYTPPEYKNNFDRITSEIGGLLGFFLMGGAGADDAPGDAPNSGGPIVPTDDEADGLGGRVDVNDEQVEGVLEADIIKRNEKYTFYMPSNRIDIYSLAGKETVKVGSLGVYQGMRDCGVNVSDITAREMFLSDDGNTLTVISSCLGAKKQRMIGVLSVDVTNAEEPKPLSAVAISGDYSDSRMKDGELMLFTEFFVNLNPDFSDPEEFIPAIDKGEGAELISGANIICPDKINSRRYTVVLMLGEGELEHRGVYAFLSYTDNFYVSAESVYLVREYNESLKTPAEGVDGGLNFVNRQMSEISRLSYGEGSLEYKGSLSLDGSIKDQYSMDEYEGMLRVVTSTSGTEGRNYVYYNNLGDYTVESEDKMVTVDRVQESVDLYVIDLDTLSVVGSVIGFAPQGERAESVRFDRESAYVCTAIVITFTDPVYFFDLSDPENITYTDTGEIDGYSTSLINMGNGFLLGVGTESGFDLKIEVYEERGGEVVSVSKYILKDTEYPTNYKCYYVNREMGLVGLPADVYSGTDGSYSRYLVFYFDGYQLNLVINEDVGGGFMNLRRGFFDSGYFYIFSENGVRVAEW